MKSVVQFLLVAAVRKHSLGNRQSGPIKADQVKKLKKRAIIPPPFGGHRPPLHSKVASLLRIKTGALALPKTDKSICFQKKVTFLY